MIELEKVSKTYPGEATSAVKDIDLEVGEGEFLVLLGESGCGKTTTLKMINRLIEPTSGRILVDGKDVSTVDPVMLRRGIGYVFQEIGLFPHMSVADNVAAVPKLLGWGKAKIGKRVDELLEMVGLPTDRFRDRSPSELSGGQRQRIGVARALAAGPQVMLMDEPFGALDPITRSALQSEFEQLQKNLGLTVVMVTHDVTEALLLADKIAVMEAGFIIRIDTPRMILTDPGHPYVSSLMETPRKQTLRMEKIIGEKETDDV